MAVGPPPKQIVECWMQKEKALPFLRGGNKDLVLEQQQQIRNNNNQQTTTKNAESTTDSPGKGVRIDWGNVDVYILYGAYESMTRPGLIA